MTGSRCRLIVLAKEPQPGKVKTRLCPPYSPAQAAQLAHAALADTLAAVLATAARGCARGRLVEPVLALSGSPGPWLSPLLDGPAALRVIPQRAGSLDVRIAAAFDDATAGCADRSALLIGMDTPQVTDALLTAAVERLTSPGCDAVLGRALDGGWWGMGLRRPEPAHVVGVPMSTSETGSAQQDRLTSSGLRVQALPVLRDVDTAPDADRVAALAPRTRFAATVNRLRVGVAVA